MSSINSVVARGIRKKPPMKPDFPSCNDIVKNDDGSVDV
jgi:hypothetical protein